MSIESTNEKTTEQVVDDFSTSMYKVCLENFEGPLDLLLQIIKENKMDIETVKLADITEQYLEYIKDIDVLDMENASEFITIAATLIEIKSKSLLPKDPVDIPEEEDPEKQLIARLKELKLFKEASQKLQTIENVDRLYKEPDKLANNVRVILKDMILDNLLDAFALMMAKTEKKAIIEEPKTISKDRFTVAEKIISIKNAVREKRIVKFSELFEEDQKKSELVNIFLALLELLKMQFVKAQQSEIFGEIDIIANEENLPNE